MNTAFTGRMMSRSTDWSRNAISSWEGAVSLRSSRNRLSQRMGFIKWSDYASIARELLRRESIVAGKAPSAGGSSAGLLQGHQIFDQVDKFVNRDGLLEAGRYDGQLHLLAGFDVGLFVTGDNARVAFDGDFTRCLAG